MEGKHTSSQKSLFLDYFELYLFFLLYLLPYFTQEISYYTNYLLVFFASGYWILHDYII